MRIIGTTVTLIIITHTTLHNRVNEARQDVPVMLSANGFHFAHETSNNSNAKFARDNVKAFNT